MSGVMSAVISNPVGLILIAALFGVGGQLSLKLGMTQVGRIGAGTLAEPLQALIRIATSPLVIGGLALYILGAGVWMMVLSRSALSFAYPVLAVGYAITPVLAWMLLGESLNGVRWAGIAIISLGIFVVSRS